MDEPTVVKKSGQRYQCMGFVGFQSLEELCLYAEAKGYWIGSNVKGAISPEEFESRIDQGESLQSILGLNVQQIMSIEFVTPEESQRRIRVQIEGLKDIARGLKRRTLEYYGEPETSMEGEVKAGRTGDLPGGTRDNGYHPVIEVPRVSESAIEKVEFEEAKPLDS